MNDDDDDQPQPAVLLRLLTEFGLVLCGVVIGYVVGYSTGVRQEQAEAVRWGAAAFETGPEGLPELRYRVKEDGR